MRRYPIRFGNTEDVMSFVKTVNGYQGEVDLKSGSILIDAKSLMGAISLSGADSLEMLIYEDDCEGFLDTVSEYLTA